MKIKILKKLKNRKGQSILEFALITPFIFFMIFIHIQLCISYVLAEYTNYVSFMAARSVLTNGHLTQQHTAIINRYIPDRLRGILRIKSADLVKYEPTNSQNFVNGSTAIKPGPQYNVRMNDTENRNLGVRIRYNIPVFLPFIRGLMENVQFEATTILGREPYHGSQKPIPWYRGDPMYGDSFGSDSACSSVYNDDGC